ncbi:MAG: ABC transporter substrate-binding protein [Hyphomicrobiales bacterium]|nr:ABC transporter substrate-binding protein [Hyphomicrobiales bacterium]
MNRFATRRAVLATGLASALLPCLAFAQSKKIRVGVLRLASSGPVFIAQDEGFFKDAGLDVELVFFDAAQPIAVAAASGDVDFGVTAFTAGLFNLAGKGALAVIAGQSREVPGFPLDAYLATAQPNGAALQAPKDIRGRRIGITQVGSSFHFAAGLLAEKYGFPISDVKFVPLQSMSNVVAALKGGAVDGAILPATGAEGAIASGAARLLGWGGDEAPWQLGAAFVAAKTKSDEKTIAAFLSAYRRGCRAYHDAFNVKDAAANRDALLAIIGRYTNQPPATVAKTLAYVDPEARLDVANVEKQIAWYQAQGFVDKGFTVEQVVDRRFVTG